jgi:hypothetical protein
MRVLFLLALLLLLAVGSFVKCPYTSFLFLQYYTSIVESREHTRVHVAHASGWSVSYMLSGLTLQGFPKKPSSRPIHYSWWRCREYKTVYWLASHVNVAPRARVLMSQLECRSQIKMNSQMAQVVVVHSFWMDTIYNTCGISTINCLARRVASSSRKLTTLTFAKI